MPEADSFSARRGSIPPRSTCRAPCPTCPWRRDQDARAIPGFSLEKAEGLAETCPDERNMGPNFGAPQFACHQSRDGAEVVCAGWLAVVGHRHPGVRLNVALGHTSPEALERPEGVDLHDSYSEVIVKLRESCP